ncbi:HIRAN domain-containing protein [Flavobacterium sp.]|uniref:HIRAN domain-containing protein n=1 Tax=Flavobacterium sp. TaxID=239 RepID=UPI0035272E18
MTRGTFLRNLIGLYGIASLPIAMVKQYQKVYLLQCFVRGFQYYNGPKIIEEINKSGLLEMVREPKNKYDKNAIALHFNHQKIGFIPRESNEMIATLIDTGLLNLQAEITHIEKRAMDWEKIHVAIYVMKELEEGTSEELLPFTLLETPQYCTLKSKHNTYTRLYFEEDEEVLSSENFYKNLVANSSTDEVYTLIHDSFPNSQDMDEAVDGSKMVVSKHRLPSTVSLLDIGAKLNDEIILIENAFDEKGYIVANVNAIATMPDKIARFEKIFDKHGNDFYEVIFKS